MQNLSTLKEKARTESALNQCGQFVNFKITGTEGEQVKGYFYLSDWFDSDSTVVGYSCGREI